MISHGFGDPHLVRSQLGLGFATLFMSIASFTTTIGILNYSGVELKMVPWYLLLVVPFACTLENALLLTDAVVSAGCDMHVKEKLGRGNFGRMLPILPCSLMPNMASSPGKRRCSNDSHVGCGNGYSGHW